MSDYGLIYITFPNAEQAEQIAESLVQQKLIACANIMHTHTAIYEWQGKLQKEQEVLLLAKTLKSSFQAIKNYVCANHEYETPCIMMLEISDANSEFLHWIDQTTK